MSNRATNYEQQVTGKPLGTSYVVNGYKFDGVRDDGTLIEAKGPGYAQFVGDNGDFKPFFNGAQQLVDQAINQLSAAEGADVEWDFAEPVAAKATQDLFAANGIVGIKIVVIPPK